MLFDLKITYDLPAVTLKQVNYYILTYTIKFKQCNTFYHEKCAVMGGGCSSV